MSYKKDLCPQCSNPALDGNARMNCLKCMNCKQKMHLVCLVNKSYSDKPNDGSRGIRTLADDIYKCPSCGSSYIEKCIDPYGDVNRDIKNAIIQNPNRRGGRKNKTHRKNSKKNLRKNRKTKHNRSKRSKTSKKV